MAKTLNGRENAWDHTTHQAFYDYYAKESQSEATLARFQRTQTAVVRVAEQTPGQLHVADIGSGAGTPNVPFGCNAGIGSSDWTSMSP